MIDEPKNIGPNEGANHNSAASQITKSAKPSEDN